MFSQLLLYLNCDPRIIPVAHRQASWFPFARAAAPSVNESAAVPRSIKLRVRVACGTETQ
jgi:hypothetical protein